MTSTRLHYIDIAKGIGIVLVYLGHMIHFYTPLWNFIMLFHMPLFFFISGFLFNEDRYSFAGFLKARLKSLILPFFIFGSFAVLVELITNSGYHIEQLKSDAPNVFWFLPVLFSTEIFVKMLFRVIKTNVGKCIICLSLSVIGIFLLQHNTIYDLSLVPICAAFYSLGNLNKTNKLFDAHCYKIKVFCAFILFLILYAFALCSHESTNLANHQLACGYLGFIMAIAGTIGVLFLSQFIDVYVGPSLKGILIYCGQNSLLIYALHMSMMRLIVALFLPIKHLFGPVQYHLCFLVENIVNILLIWMLVEFFRRKARWVYGKF